MSLSMRAYAAHRKSKGLSGGTLNAVQKAIKSGRIALDNNGKIDLERADREWAGNTVDVPEETLAGGIPSAIALAPLSSMNSKGAMIRAARDANRLEIERMELAVKRGTYVEASKVREEFEQVVHVLRAALEPIPARVKAQRPEMDMEDIILIERMVQQALNEVVRYDPLA